MCYRARIYYENKLNLKSNFVFTTSKDNLENIKNINTIIDKITNIKFFNKLFI